MYIHRLAEGKAFESIASTYVTCLLGQRRAGKTTLVEAVIWQNRQELWVQN